MKQLSLFLSLCLILLAVMSCGSGDSSDCTSGEIKCGKTDGTGTPAVLECQIVGTAGETDWVLVEECIEGETSGPACNSATKTCNPPCETGKWVPESGSCVVTCKSNQGYDTKLGICYDCPPGTKADHETATCKPVS
jgi:hypothetical protein